MLRTLNANSERDAGREEVSGVETPVRQPRAQHVAYKSLDPPHCVGSLPSLPQPLAPPRMSLSPGSDPASPPSSSTNEKTPRTKNACAVCFQKKVRCTGERPRCNRCVSKGVECVYVEGGNSRVPKKRASVSTNPAPARRARVSAPPQASEPRPAPSGEVVVATPPPPPPPPVRQPYFRWIGLTAVAPPLRGASFRALSVAVSQAAAAEKSNATPGPSTASVPPLQPPAETSPSTTVATFYETLESFLPFTPRGETEEMIAAGTFSEMVLAAMEALATRYALDVLFSGGAGELR